MYHLTLNLFLCPSITCSFADWLLITIQIWKKYLIIKTFTFLSGQFIVLPLKFTLSKIQINDPIGGHNYICIQPTPFLACSLHSSHDSHLLFPSVNFPSSFLHRGALHRLFLAPGTVILSFSAWLNSSLVKTQNKYPFPWEDLTDGTQI